MLGIIKITLYIRDRAGQGEEVISGSEALASAAANFGKCIITIYEFDNDSHRAREIIGKLVKFIVLDNETLSVVEKWDFAAKWNI